MIGGQKFSRQGVRGRAVGGQDVGGSTQGIPKELEEINTPEEIWEAMAVLRRKQAKLGGKQSDLR